jgi:hypothetical protein
MYKKLDFVNLYRGKLIGLGSITGTSLTAPAVGQFIRCQSTTDGVTVAAEVTKVAVEYSTLTIFVYVEHPTAVSIA